MKCISVRLKSLIRISDKAFRAEDFGGNTDVIPVSQIFGQDYDVGKSEAYWISEWILEKKELTYSRKKSAFFDSETLRMLPTIVVEKHKPVKIEPLHEHRISSLRAE